MDAATSAPPVGELSVDEYAAYKAGRALYVYLSPLLLAFGLVGNVLSFLVMSKRARTPPPTYLYLTVLAFVDVLALYVPCVRGWLVFVAGVDVMLLMGCGWYFIVYFSVCNFSVYIVICVTVDRFMHTFFALSAKRLCTLRSAVYALVGVASAVTIINFHYPWTLRRVLVTSNTSQSTEYECQTSPGYERWMADVWPYLDLTVYSFLPFMVLMTCNLLIIYRLAAQSKKMRSVRSSGQPHDGKVKVRTSKTTVMLIVLSFMQLLTTSPVVALHISETFWDRSHPSQAALHFLATAICEHFMYLNNCLNFVLYFLSARKFREELMMTLFKRGLQRVQPSNMENTLATVT